MRRPSPPRKAGRRRAGRLLAALLTALASVVLALSPPDPDARAAAKAAPNLITNPGLENLGADGFPTCFEKSGYGDNDHTFTVTGAAGAHSGGHAVELTITRLASGDRKMMMLENDCAPAVVPDHQYDVSAWYRTTSPNTVITLFRHDAVGGWTWWTDLKTLPVTADYARAEVRTPPVPAGTDRITWGITLYGTGTLATDDYAMTDATVPRPEEPVCAPEDTSLACDGRWTVLDMPSPVRAIHSVLLNNGKVLLIAGSGNDRDAFKAGTFKTTVFDPATDTFTDIPTPDDFFCAGHVQLPDGRVLVMGGNKDYAALDGSVSYKGLKTSYVFDPATNRYTRTNDMIAGHWYPSATAMGNGDVTSFGGLDETANGTVLNERFDHTTGAWKGCCEKQTWSFWGLYPAMILLQDGRLFYTGSHVFGVGLPGTGASLYDYDMGTITDVPGLRRKDERDESMSVLLPPAQDQRVLTVGGGNHTITENAHRLTDLIDLKADDPAYVPGPDLPHGHYEDGTAQTGEEGKVYVSTVILPDGKVLETGGALHTYREKPVFEASLFNPASGAFEPGLATDPVPRTYHSSSLLLPDGRVLSVGNNPGDGSFDRRISIYEPPYLFRGARPRITSAASNEWAYGSTQRITVDKPVTKASLIRPAAVTHSSDPNQRYVDLPMTVAGGNTIDLNLTSNPNLAPPGWYMLSVVGADGLPSASRWVHIGGETAATAHTQPFADDPSAAPKPKKQRRARAVTLAEGYDGCDHTYGTGDQCVPWRFPRGVAKADRCAWLLARGYGAMKTHGRDRHRLDRNRDGTACGRGD
ncbi:galactose oxidase early set domain-containing protein [Streptomyces sp. NPDC005355]|uniref:galactose oxidase early set domain-containing protein n=1 Tax=Streptomyces sp. NPDC005355 TaxID=3157038 RepID=UPI0033AF3082